MDFLSLLFKLVCVTFSFAAVATGLQAMLDPVTFSNSFGMWLALCPPKTHELYHTFQHLRITARSYISLMGMRQFTTGIILLIFACQSKWTEAAF